MRVLDASAVIAWAFEEEGADLAEQAFDGGLISTVNYAEVVQRLMKRGESEEECVACMGESGLRVIDADLDAAIIAARLHVHKDLSIGDRFCIALGALAETPVVTADRDWATLPLPAQIELIR